MELLPENVYNKLKQYGFTKKIKVKNSNNWYWCSIERMIKSKERHNQYIDLCDTDSGLGMILVLAYHFDTEKYFFRRTGGANPAERLEAIKKDQNYIPRDSELISFTQAIQLITNI